MRGTLAERFWAKVNKDGLVPAHKPGLGPCWVWTADVINSGYGRIGKDGKTALAHRVACELLIGPIPEGLEPDHLCSNTACVKAIADEHGPAHLDLVTHAENTRRAQAQKTHCPRGHPYTPENTYRRSNGVRSCRICTRGWERKRKAR
jgi:hypothetical protein